MPKLNVTEITHAKVKKTASSLNYTLLEFTEKVLTQVCESN